MDGQLSRKKVIGSPIYEESLERTFVEGIERFGMFQARKYLEHILNTVVRMIPKKLIYFIVICLN